MVILASSSVVLMGETAGRLWLLVLNLMVTLSGLTLRCVVIFIPTMVVSPYKNALRLPDQQPTDQNELTINATLSVFSNAVNVLLRNQAKNRPLSMNLDLVLPCSDEMILMSPNVNSHISHPSHESIMETDLKNVLVRQLAQSLRYRDCHRPAGDRG